MVLLLIGIVIGAIITIILIVKYFKTNPQEVLGFHNKCQKCGLETKGMKCPRCEKNKQAFGV
jgi:hypothetical protein